MLHSYRFKLQTINFSCTTLARFLRILNISIKEKDFTIADIHSADEAFVTGTFAGIIPAVEIDGKVMSRGVRGEITHMLQDLYTEKLAQLFPRES